MDPRPFCARLGRSVTLAGTLSILLALLAVTSPDAAAQPPVAEPVDDVAQPPAPVVEEPAADAPETPARPRELTEQTIYIPYDKLREVFETEGRGVFLPYERFRELWAAAYERTQPPDAVKPPVAALITETDNDAVVAADVIRVTARLKLEVLGTGWHRVALRLADAAITRATIDGQPARIVHEPGGYVLLVHRRRDSDPTELSLDLEYARTFTKTPGRNSVEFQAPQAPVSRWQVRVDEPGVKIDIQPLIAASEVPQPDGAASQIQAFVGAADRVRIDWTPRAEGAAGLEVLATVQAQQQVYVEETAVRVRATLSWAISRAELDRLVLEVPAAYRVANVFDPNVRRWSVEPPAEGAAVQRVVVELFESASRSQSLVVELEQFQSEGHPERELAVPVIRALDVGRQQGVVVVRVAEGLRAQTARRSGLMQVDGGELPAGLERETWTFSFRYAAVPFDLALSVEKVQPEISVDWVVRTTLEPQRLSLLATAVLHIERAGVFRLEFDLPEGFEVGQVRGRSAEGIAAAQVDAFRTEGEEGRRLVVNLSRKAQGRVGLTIPLDRRLSHAELLQPTGSGVELGFDLPRLAEVVPQRVDGRLLLYAPESLRVNPQEATGLRAASPDEAARGTPVEVPVPSNMRLVQSYLFGQESARLTVSAERRRPFVTARQLLVARFEPGVVKYEAAFAYAIQFSGLKSLRIDVPADLAPRLRNESPGLRDAVMVPPPEDLADGYVAWSLTGDAELLGAVTVRLAWEDQLENLDVGTRVDVRIPHLRPQGTDRAWGQIVLAKSDAIDVQESGQPQGVRPIDPRQDLADSTAIEGAARAFEFQDDWSLTVAATRYELEEVKRTSIELGVVRSVYTRGRQVSVQALYRMRSARQRLGIVLPAGATFDIEPLRIEGRSVTLEKGKQDEFFAPLVGVDTERPFLLELRYTLSEQPTRFALPQFPDEPAAQKLYLAVYLPEELAVVHSAGPWTDEFRWVLDETNWRYSGGFGLVPVPNLRDADLVRQVTDHRELAGSFQTDGQMYLFSTVRPQGAAELDLRTARRTTLSMGVLAGVLVLGMLLLRGTWTARAVFVGVVLVAWAAASVWRPMLAWQLVNGMLFTAVAMVAVLWGIAAVATRRRRPSSAAPLPAPDKPLHEPPPETEQPSGGETSSGQPASQEPAEGEEGRHE